MRIAVERFGAHARNPAYPLGPVHLSGVAPFIIRPIEPADDALERAFVSGLSMDSRYNRLLGSRKLSSEEIRRLSHIDYDREMALIAVASIDGQAIQLGAARYVKDSDATGAEFAIAVADALHRKGIGGTLMETLMQHARAAGIKRLHGTTFAANQAMQNLARKLGFVRRLDPQDGSVRQLEKTLAVTAPAAALYPGAECQVAAANDTSCAPHLP